MAFGCSVVLLGGLAASGTAFHYRDGVNHLLAGATDWSRALLTEAETTPNRVSAHSTERGSRSQWLSAHHHMSIAQSALTTECRSRSQCTLLKARVTTFFSYIQLMMYIYGRLVVACTRTG